MNAVFKEPIHSKSLEQVIFIFSIYQTREKQFSRVLIGFLRSENPWQFSGGEGTLEIRGREGYGRREKKGRDCNCNGMAFRHGIITCCSVYVESHLTFHYSL